MRALGFPLRMTMDATLAFVLAFGANVMWNILVGTVWMKHGPHGLADNWAVAAVFWYAPFIGHLVVLYRKAVFVRWPRVFRAVGLCGISFAATLAAVWMAFSVAGIVWFILHGAPKPNEVTSADGGRPVLFASIAQWPAAAEFLRYAASVAQSGACNPPAGVHSRDQ